MLEYVRSIYKDKKNLLFTKISLLGIMSLTIFLAAVNLFPSLFIFAYYMIAFFVAADIIIFYLLAFKSRNIDDMALLYRLIFYATVSIIALAVII